MTPYFRQGTILTLPQVRDLLHVCLKMTYFVYDGVIQG